MRKLFVILLLAACWLTAGAQAEVERWGRFEASFKASFKADVKGNPFDVALTATFSGPDTTFTVRGFYDKVV